MKSSRRILPVVGWREWVGLDELSELPIKAKIDTGARTSSLHAFNLQLSEDVATDVVVATFEIHPLQRSSDQVQSVKTEVLEFRDVRSSTGHTERRPVIRTPVTVGEYRFDIDITLTSRDEMGFRMLLGRSAVRRRFLVDPGRSYQQGELK
ncbi:MAG: ATP-dependent zinc protease family protein [Acidimicrobiales bacterium]